MFYESVGVVSPRRLMSLPVGVIGCSFIFLAIYLSQFIKCRQMLCSRASNLSVYHINTILEGIV